MKNTATYTIFKASLLRFSIILLLQLIAGQNVKACYISSSECDSIVKETTRFIVSFGSICCGINHKKHEEFLTFLGKYPTKVNYTQHSWGEEGEFDYCFTLKELPEKKQEEFIKKARKVLGNDRTIGTYENIACPR